MRQNVCGAERIIRFVIGIVIILAGVYYGSWWGAIGLIPLVTAVIKYCPLSQAFRFSSCSVRTSP